jgi:hypothetical protein
MGGEYCNLSVSDAFDISPQEERNCKLQLQYPSPFKGEAR